MGQPFLGEIKIMSFNFAPQGWAMCNGQFLPINQNQPLFALLGTMYGGNGQTTFALPDLRGQTPIHVGSSFNVQGQKGGEQAHTLSIPELPTHVHSVNATTNAASTDDGTNNVIAQAGANVFVAPASPVAMNPAMVTSTGGSQAHQNMQPFLTLTFCIALQGIFPSRN